MTDNSSVLISNTDGNSHLNMPAVFEQLNRQFTSYLLSLVYHKSKSIHYKTVKGHARQTHPSHKSMAVNVSLCTVTVSFLEQYRQYIVLIYRLWNLMQHVVLLGLYNTRCLFYFLLLPHCYVVWHCSLGGNSLYSVNIFRLESKKRSKEPCRKIFG